MARDRRPINGQTTLEDFLADPQSKVDKPSSIPGRPQVIGLLGRAGAGKDTIADYLEIEYGYNRVAFADSIKCVLEDVSVAVGGDLGYPYMRGTPEWRLAWDRLKRKSGCEYVRSMLQGLGQSMREHSGPHVWTNAVMDKILASKSDEKWVVTDVRYPNECDMIEDIGWAWDVRAELWHVSRASGSHMDHVSECNIEDLSWAHGARVLSNDGNLDDLHASVDEFMLELTA